MGRFEADFLVLMSVLAHCGSTETLANTDGVERHTTADLISLIYSEPQTSVEIQLKCYFSSWEKQPLDV